jgi:Domain of unknown function (DUF4440)
MRLPALAASLLLATALGATSRDDRAADRDAIRAHIDRIFQAFIKKDAVELRATHAQNWLGYLEGSRTMIRGIDGYMDWNQVDPRNPYGLKSYKMREFDMIFQGDAAFVCFTADLEGYGPNGPTARTLRIADFYTRKDGEWIQNGSDTELHPESIAAQGQTPRTLPEPMKKQLLAAREAVWRAYFANDRAALEKMIPDEAIAIDAGNETWGDRKAILEGAERFAKSGGKLVGWSSRRPRSRCMARRRSCTRATRTRWRSAARPTGKTGASPRCSSCVRGSG